MAFRSAVPKAVQTILYLLAWACAVVILGLYSYFLATQAQHNVAIPNWQKAVEGISGAAVLYTTFAVLLTCFLGGKKILALIAIVLDIAFVIAFIAIAVLTRDGSRCSRPQVETPLGYGDRGSNEGRDGAIYTPTLATACRLNQVCMAVAIIGAFLFLICAFFQIWLARSHDKQKRLGTTAPVTTRKRGNGLLFFKRKNRAEKDAELGTYGAGAHPAETTTGSYTGNKYESTDPAYNGHNNNGLTGHHNNGITGHHNNGLTGHNSAAPTAGGYHTAPAGTGVNPYGYDNRV